MNGEIILVFDLSTDHISARVLEQTTVELMMDKLQRALPADARVRTQGNDTKTSRGSDNVSS